MSSMLSWGMSPQDSISKYLQKGWAVAQVVECLSGTCKVLGPKCDMSIFCVCTDSHQASVMETGNRLHLGVSRT
jgi:hypothetical protein